MTKSKKILEDHKRIGKTFVPPILQFGKFVGVEWVNVMVPELIWIALINSAYGLRKGAEYSLALAHEVHLLIDKNNTSHFFCISSYSTLTQNQKVDIVNALDRKKVLEPIKDSIYPLVIYYPQCPLSFLFQGNIVENNTLLIFDFKKVLDKMFDRWNTDATFVQANAIYIAFDSGRLKVAKGSELADFPEVEHFPYTEKSKRVASFIRGCLNPYFGERDNAWPEYFWNKGLLLKKCEYRNYYERRKSK